MFIGKTQVKPSEVNYDAGRLDEVNAHFERLIKKNWIQAAMYKLSRDGKLFANAAIGKQSYLPEDKRELNDNTIFQIYSISKIITATAIFKLCEDGYIRPRQPVYEIIEEFKDAPFNKILIEHLLTHTSGLYPDEGAFNYKYLTPWAAIGITKKDDLKNWLNNALKSGIFQKPGVEWAYSSFGFCVLGEIIARVTGMTSDAYIRKTIFEPCKMKDSFFRTEVSNGILSEEFVKDYKNRLYIQCEADVEDLKKLDNYKQGSGIEVDNPVWKIVPTTSGGIHSTTGDLMNFGNMLLNGGYTADGIRVIGRKAIERMTANITGPNIIDNCWDAGGCYRMYGLGPDTRRTSDNHYSEGTFFHEGAGACSLVIDPKEKMVAAWFVPWADPNWTWHAEALYNASNVMWSGIK